MAFTRAEHVAKAEELVKQASDKPNQPTALVLATCALVHASLANVSFSKPQPPAPYVPR